MSIISRRIGLLPNGNGEISQDPQALIAAKIEKLRRSKDLFRLLKNVQQSSAFAGYSLTLRDRGFSTIVTGKTRELQEFLSAVSSRVNGDMSLHIEAAENPRNNQ